MGDVLAWNPWALPGLVAGALAVTAAAVIHTFGSTRRQTRLAALFLLFLAGFTTTASGLRLLLVQPHHAFAAWFAGVIVNAPMVFTAVLLAGSMPTPLAGPLRRPIVLMALAAYTAITVISPVLAPDLLAGGVARAPYVDSWISTSMGIVWFPLVVVMLVFLTWTALCGFSAARRATVSLEQRRMRLLGIGFAAFGLAFVVPLAIVVALVVLDGGSSVETSWLALLNFLFPPVAILVLVACLGYGVLSSHLFDIDLRLKLTLRQSTVAAIFVAVFVGVQTFVSELFTSTGGLAAGAVAAAALVFMMSPLQRMADRLSNAAMPGVQDTEEYRMVRKQEVYRAAVEAAASDGNVTEKERDMLAALQEQLGLKPTEARAMERAVLSATS